MIGIEDAFGSRARRLRLLQHQLLAIFDEHGYQEVIPPIVERPESLASGAGRFIADQTVVFSDPAGAGLLAIRPDITPQIARIAATRLSHENELKLSYSAPVLLARPDSLTGSRQQWQTGVECLGLAGKVGDMEVMLLAAIALRAANFDSPLLQVGHVGLMQALMGDSDTPQEDWAELLIRRSPEDMAAHLMHERLSDHHKEAWMQMVLGVADREWLLANKGLIGGSFEQAADELIDLVDEVSAKLNGEVDVSIDVAVVPRFLYHSSIIFSGFAKGSTRALLHGGRYDSMMIAHGRDMPATGFSFDLWSWLDAI
ncbi:MAG: ATP phosphoribosyltransferase regulatory subunit [Mariprofundaceae bacterium]